MIGLLLALLGASAADGLQGCAARNSFVLSATRFPAVHCALYHPDKLMLCSAPKVASTALFYIIISRSNTTDDFHRWAIQKGYPDPRKVGLTTIVHKFVEQELRCRPDHAPPEDIPLFGPGSLCSDPAWLCILAVRHPADRAVSSYLHGASTKIGAQWPELLETVQDERMVVAGNFSFRQHVAALELTARRQHVARRAGSDHFMPQCYTRFRALCKSQGGQSEEAVRLSGLKLIPGVCAFFCLLLSASVSCTLTAALTLATLSPVDDLVGRLGAADREFRGGTLGLGKVDTRSNHCRSGACDSAVSARQARGRMLLGQVARRSKSALADTHAAALCGKDGGFPVQFIRHSGKIVKVAGGHKCRLPHGTYADMQAENGPLWQRVRCLYADDFGLYNHAVCNQVRELRGAGLPVDMNAGTACAAHSIERGRSLTNGVIFAALMRHCHTGTEREKAI
ncbi:hypothetical protein T492DRAFT_837834 [Pavlovales sp. CCMP2436]|nr:hypothetical protein T492DRAFT_837834 [Pavlovales sp. CCMP2436]